MAKSDRAKQFMPFAALKGYYELIREKEKVIVPRRELAEDSAAELSENISRVKKGSMIKLVYYHNGEYIKAHGLVSEIDFTFRRLKLVKTDINFDDIFSLELAE